MMKRKNSAETPPVPKNGSWSVHGLLWGLADVCVYGGPFSLVFRKWAQPYKYSYRYSALDAERPSIRICYQVNCSGKERYGTCK